MLLMRIGMMGYKLLITQFAPSTRGFAASEMAQTELQLIHYTCITIIPSENSYQGLTRTCQFWNEVVR